MTTPPPQASPSRQLNIPANSRRSGPRVSLAAWSPANLTQRRHCGSPLERRTTAAGRHRPHLLGPNLNHRVPTPIIPRLASITTPLRWIRAKGPPHSAPDAHACPAGSLGGGATGLGAGTFPSSHRPGAGNGARHRRKVRQSGEPAHQTPQRQGARQSRRLGSSANGRRLIRGTNLVFS